ncbi:IS3 family transposase [Thomasclavelia spiroformis]
MIFIFKTITYLSKKDKTNVLSLNTQRIKIKGLTPMQCRNQSLLSVYKLN